MPDCRPSAASAGPRSTRLAMIRSSGCLSPGGAARCTRPGARERACSTISRTPGSSLKCGTVPDTVPLPLTRRVARPSLARPRGIRTKSSEMSPRSSYLPEVGAPTRRGRLPGGGASSEAATSCGLHGWQPRLAEYNTGAGTGGIPDRPNIALGAAAALNRRGAELRSERAAPHGAHGDALHVYPPLRREPHITSSRFCQTSAARALPSGFCDHRAQTDYPDQTARKACC